MCDDLKVPDEILLQILKHVSHDDYLNIRLVNRRFNRVSKEGCLWEKVDLVRPRTSEQIMSLATTMFPFVGDKVKDLRVTGFNDMTDYDWDEIEPRTLTNEVLDTIKASCPALSTFIIRNCRFVKQTDFAEHLPQTLEKLEFHRCRLPMLPSSWMVRMAEPGARALLDELVTLKFDNTVADMCFVRYLGGRHGLRNLTLNYSNVGIAVLHFFLFHGPPPFPRISENLKVLDLSGMNGEALLLFVNEWVVDNAQCNVTHLFMEKSPIIPRRVSNKNLKIEFLSVAGHQPPRAYGGSLFRSIKAWASIPSMKEINASGCDLYDGQRRELRRKFQNVHFNLSVEFEQSPRVEE